MGGYFICIRVKVDNWGDVVRFKMYFEGWVGSEAEENGWDS